MWKRFAASNRSTAGRRSSRYFTVITHVGLDHIRRYRDTLVPDGDNWRIKHRKVSTDWAATNSVMARGSEELS